MDLAPSQASKYHRPERKRPDNLLEVVHEH